MTFLEPKKEKNFYNLILPILGVLAFLSVIFLVIMYNQVVSLDHEISKINKQIEEEQGLTAEFKEKVFATLNSGSIKDFITENGLVPEKNPSYFELAKESPKVISANLR